MPTTSTSTTQPGVAPMVYRISVDEYERMVAAGILDDPRVELIHGLLVRKMGKNPPHVKYWEITSQPRLSYGDGVGELLAPGRK